MLELLNTVQRSYVSTLIDIRLFSNVFYGAVIYDYVYALSCAYINLLSFGNVCFI